MISVNSAEQIIRSHLPKPETEVVHYSRLSGRYLAEDILAKRPQPPFDRVTMDGIAINTLDWNVETQESGFTFQKTQFAGDKPEILERGHCIEVMTGAVLPLNADCVIPVENITLSENSYTLNSDYADTGKIKTGQFIHNKGSDHELNEILVFANTRLNATHIACLISAGYSEARVKCRPAVSIIMSGDELIQPGNEIEAFQIYASNAPALDSLLSSYDFTNTQCHLCDDDHETLERTIKNAIKQSEIVITTGGVSMGKKDLLPEIFEKLGVTCHFHRVAQKPGKPLWFGTHGDGQNKTMVFGLPGNPVSALVTTRRYIIPVLIEMMGDKYQKQIVQLQEAVNFNPELSYFLPVKINQQDGKKLADPISFNTSGDTVSLTYSDGFVELNSDKSVFMAGEAVEYFPW